MNENSSPRPNQLIKSDFISTKLAQLKPITSTLDDWLSLGIRDFEVKFGCCHTSNQKTIKHVDQIHCWSNAQSNMYHDWAWLIALYCVRDQPLVAWPLALVTRTSPCRLLVSIHTHTHSNTQSLTGSIARSLTIHKHTKASLRIQVASCCLFASISSPNDNSSSSFQYQPSIELYPIQTSSW